MMRKLSVDCIFNEDGTVQVRRIRRENGRWQPVQQGRQWLDDKGRHVLVMLVPQTAVQELLLHANRLQWELQERPSAGTKV